MLILRDFIVHGPRTYSEFLESPEHISNNILAAKLNLLTHLKLIERTNSRAAARDNAFQLTESGVALRPVVKAFGRWSQIRLKEFHNNVFKLP